jgi:hypothetical protein
MSNTNTGGPAFPFLSYNTGDNLWYQQEGMTLRDYFAAKAMQGIVCAPHSTDDDKTAAVYLSDGLGFSDGMRGRVAVAAYALADAMLKAREA